MKKTIGMVRNDIGINMSENEERDISPDKDGGLRKKLLEKGHGKDYPNFGDKVTLRYTAYKGDEIYPEYMFDSSETDGKPFTYECLKGQVVKGFELGVLTMTEGERAQLFLKPEYAYGRGGSPPKIPADTPVIFDTEIIKIECPDLSPAEDRTILKKTLEKGRGFTFANEGAMVDMSIKGECDGRVFIEKDIKFQLGEGSSELYKIPECVEKVLDQWKQGEYARLSVAAKHAYGAKGNEHYGIGPNKDLVFYIRMNKFERAKEFWEMDNKEKMDQCDMFKEKGNTYFKRQEYNLAEKYYDQIVESLQNDLCMQGEEEKRRKQTLVVGNLNLAQAQLKLANNIDARDSCDRALKLDPKSVKGYYRRGMAQFHCQEFEKAKQDFEKVLELDPTVKDARDFIVKCGKKIKQDAEESKTLAQKMMSQLGKGVTDGAQRYASGMNDIGDWDNAMAHGMMSLEEEREAFGDTIPRNGDNNHGMCD